MSECICPIAARAKKSPHERIMITEEKTWTAEQLDRAIAYTCASLRENGIQPKDHVAFIANMSVETILILFALLRLKAVACLLNPREPKETWPHLAQRCSATHWIDPTCLPSSKQPLHQQTIDEHAIATMLHTSGSTGTPKIACHTFKQHRLSAEGILPFLHYNPNSLVYLSLPLFHVGGLALLFRTMFSGATALLSPAPLQEVLQNHKVTHASIVPTQLYRLLEHSPFPTHTSLLLGGASTAKPLLDHAKKAGLYLFHSYGCTEMSSTITLARESCTITMGMPLPYRKIDIQKTGEIYVKGETLFSGYWDPKTRMPYPLTTNGWFATKDLAQWTSNGLLYIGRMDRQFISGGENIQPEEIENALLSIDGILRATVTPIQDDEYGQRPIAYIHDTHRDRNPEMIKEKLQASLPRFKIPKQILPIQKMHAFSNKDYM